MTGREHVYTVTVTWTGNQGSGTSGYAAYSRNHVIEAAGKPPIPGSADPSFRGDRARWTPEDLLVASLSACHKLWYLHLCAVSGIRVLAYIDEASGTMSDQGDAGGQFTSVTLRPVVTIERDNDHERAQALHHDAHTKCFIANSMNFPMTIVPTVKQL
jgi:organic hydroperoxide reductase OsmC/OhrA